MFYKYEFFFDYFYYINIISSYYCLLIYSFSNIKTSISKRAVCEIEINVIDGDIKENKLKVDLDKGMFKNPGYLHVILFLCKTENEVISLREKIESVLKIGLLEDIVVVISDAILGEKNLFGVWEWLR